MCIFFEFAHPKNILKKVYVGLSLLAQLAQGSGMQFHEDDEFAAAAVAPPRESPYAFSSVGPEGYLAIGLEQWAFLM